MLRKIFYLFWIIFILITTTFGQSDNITTAFPAPIALAASWDTSLMYEVGKAMATETLSKERDFKSFGEDPYLAGRMAASFIRGVESENVMAYEKKYAGNNQEWESRQFKAGLFDDPKTSDNTVIYRNEHKQLALKAARESIVLLKNKKGLLPLNVNNIRSIALIGPNIFEARAGGGGGSKVTFLCSVSTLEGIQHLAGDKVKIYTACGVVAMNDIIPLSPEFMKPNDPSLGDFGLWGEYFNNTELEGEPVYTSLDRQINFKWGYDVPHPELYRVNDRNLFSVRWTGKLIPPETGNYKLNIINNDKCRLFIDDQLIIDNRTQNQLKLNSANYYFKREKEYDIRLECFFDEGISEVKFGWEREGEDLISIATYRAKHADVAIVFVGLSNRFESESFTGKGMDLPNQAKLIKEVVKANPNTIIVIETDSPVLIESWIKDVPAVIQAWYPGQESGNAVAEVLFGKYNPSGKLPFSLIRNNNDLPAFDGYMNEGLVGDYHEEIYVGYRYLDRFKIKPLFPFGHGLSYTTIGIGKLLIRKGKNKNEFIATIEVRNFGDMAGTEVIQLYVHDPEGKVKRPEKELKGFARVTLEPGEKKVVRIPFNRDVFAYFNEETNQWTVEPGLYDILIGTSAGNIKLKKTIY